MSVRVKHYAIEIIRDFKFDKPDKTACGKGDEKSSTKSKTAVTCKACLRWIERTDRAIANELRRPL